MGQEAGTDPPAQLFPSPSDGNRMAEEWCSDRTVGKEATVKTTVIMTMREDLDLANGAMIRKGELPSEGAP